MKISYILALSLTCHALFADTAKVYVTEIHGGSVSVINVEDDSVQTISGFSDPRVIKITPNGALGYVGEDTNDIQIFETATHLVTSEITGINHPVALAISPDGMNAFVASSNDTITTIDLTDNSIVSVLTGFNDLQDVKVTPDGQFIYVTNAGDNTVSVIDRSIGIVVTIIEGFDTPLGIAISNDGTHAFVTNVGSDSLSVIRISDNSIVATISGLNDPKYTAVSPDGTLIYVASFGDNSVKAIPIDSPDDVMSIPVFQPAALAITPDSKYLYVSSGSSTMVKIRLSDQVVIKTLNGFKNPTNVTAAHSPQPCQFVDGCHGFEEFLCDSHFYNQIHWDPAPGNPFVYKIYRDADLTDLAGETRHLLFKECVSRSSRMNYYVVAEYDNGFSSTVGNITILPCHRCY